jgi:hypothetical protein
MTEARRLTARFGENRISDPRLRVHVEYPENNAGTATLIVPNDLINAASPDYRAPVEIVVERVDGEDQALFTGFVDEVTPEGSDVRLNLTTQTQIMSETRIGGLGYAGVRRLEMLWAVARLGGYLPENIDIEGWEAGPTEVFEVATAIDGLSVERPITFGRVSL